MNDLISQLGSSFLSKNIENIAWSMWLPKEVTAQAVKVALPAVMWKISENAKTEEWANSLFEALKGHDGSVLDNIKDVAADPDAAGASGILGHVFGDSQSDIEKQIVEATGANPEQAQKILKIVAPIVMGSMWKAQDNGMDMAGMVSGLSKMSGWKSSNLLTSFLDKDGDGDIKDDLLNMGMDHLKKKFFKG